VPGEISDVVSNRVLSSEINAKFIISNVCPEFGFCGGGLFAQFDGAGSDLRVASGQARHFFPS